MKEAREGGGVEVCEGQGGGGGWAPEGGSR